MKVSPASQRTRNAAATRAAILEAACSRFALEGYDGASLRDLASDAGVDAALVCRYFGSKEDLFAEVLASCAPPNDLLEGDIAQFGERVARMLVTEPRNHSKLDHLLIILRSASSPRAAEIIRRNSRESFYGPLEAWIGEPDAAVKARAVAGVLMGFAVARAVDEDYMLAAADREKLLVRVAGLLQAAIS